jgi:hypothetical protein
MQSAGPEAPIDRVRAKPERQQLPPGHDPMLPPRQTRNDGVRATSVR